MSDIQIDGDVTLQCINCLYKIVHSFDKEVLVADEYCPGCFSSKGPLWRILEVRVKQ